MVIIIIEKNLSREHHQQQLFSLVTTAKRCEEGRWIDRLIESLKERERERKTEKK